MTESKRQLRVFLCHASADKPSVRDLYRHLVRDGVDVWMDETSLLPGMDWRLEIPRAVQKADAIIICLSNHSVTKEGYIQKEIRFALDAAEEKPDGVIYILPVRLEACEIPSRLERWQWVDLFSSDGYRKLRISLRLRAEAVGATMASVTRKFETGNSHPRESLATSKLEGNTMNFGSNGRLFAVLSVLVLACAGLLWAGVQLSERLNPAPLPTSQPTFTSTMTSSPGIMLPPTLPFSPTPFQPVLLPTATFPPPTIPPTLTFTFPPTQTSIPTFTFTPSATPYPQPAMALIPAGNFQMGRDDGKADEAPLHTVFLDDFYIDQYEVTNEMYHFCVQSRVCQPPAETANIPTDYYGVNYADHPVVNVSWNMAQVYCGWRAARLPTEAEWEKAARGGLTRAVYSWGNEMPTCDTGSRNGAFFDDCSKITKTMTEKVGSYFPNGYRLFDMAGNVWEWTADWYDGSYYSQPAASLPNPQGPLTAPDVAERAVRGGGWNEPAIGIYVANRNSAEPDLQDNEIGFRCVRDANP